MSTSSTTPATAEAQQEQDLAALAARWPQFSSRELARLRFHVYRRRTRRIRPPAPVSAETDALCAALLAGAAAPDPAAQPPIPAGVPPMWASWAERQRALRWDSAA
jgi:hypothetical protein